MFEPEPEGATPIDDDEAADLIPKHIRRRDDLNVWEQENILKAAHWAESARKSVLDEGQVRALHRRMFDETWMWAGRYRTSDKNIGVPWSSVSTEVRQLVDDGCYWIENDVYSIDEIALRLHHRLVFVHPFPNGNGRHARLWGDIILRQNGRPPLEWRSPDLDHTSEARTAYIDALRSADMGNYDPLTALILRERE